MKTVLVCLCLLLLPLGSASACFGPKLYLGAAEEGREAAAAALITLYVKEKTGIETVLETVAAAEGAARVRAETLDMTLTPESASDLAVLLRFPDGLLLHSGKRPLEELQFSTVAPALKKLEALLTTEIMTQLTTAVASGAAPLAAARQLLRERRWI